MNIKNTGSILQEIAAEIAFLEPAQLQGLGHMAALLTQLEHLIASQTSSLASQELTWAMGVLQHALAHEQGLTSTQLEALQASFERMQDALYLAKPLAPQTRAQQDPHPASSQEEESFVLENDADLELLNEFCNEGRDLLQQVEQGVLVLEENPTHKDTLNQVFRAFHTFKGGAGFLGIKPIQHLAHQLESVLDAARQNHLTITREVIEVILAGGDALQLYIKAIAQQLQGEGRGQAIVVPTAALVARAQACMEGTPPPAAEHQTHIAEAAIPSQEHTQAQEPASALIPTQIKGVRDNIQADMHSPASRDTEAAQALTKPTNKIAHSEHLTQFVKLDTRKLDTLVDLMGELVIAQSMVVQHPDVRISGDRNLERYLRQLSRITTDLQHNAMSLRMVPIRSVMQKMARLVRDLAASQNKQIQLHLNGEDTELDRKIVEELADPLLHMMRNAVDHGIETPAERIAQGKSPQGNIHLQALHQGGGILIRIRDDGKGLNAKKILSKARQRGLIAADSEPSEKDIYNLIFLPGFSTADSVTEISGRGVGMDVVRGSINKLRGRVDIDSEPGLGTTFNIFLPLTLAIIDAMLVGVGQERFILPTLTIRESLKPQPGMVFTVQGKGEVISVRGKLIPLTRLSTKLGLPGKAQDPCDGIVIVVDSGNQNRALLVDSLIGKQEVVIKSLGEIFKHQQGMSGAAILSDGRVALIIDPDSMGQWPSVSALAA
jgi:two-component system, chemotaxis family, sensor kinase CheA